MRGSRQAQGMLFGPDDSGLPRIDGEQAGGPPFGTGDRPWMLERIDPRFAKDPLFDAPDELFARSHGRRRRGVSRTLASVTLLLGAASLGACGEEPKPLHTGDAVLVQLKPGERGLSHLSLDDEGPPVVALANLAAEGEPPLLRLPLPRGRRTEDFVRELSGDAAVDFAEPVYLHATSRVPDDPRFRDLWGVAKIAAPAVWERTTGDRKVVVAVIDDGVALDHPDLAPNLWTNPDEVAGNGRDDDGDGYIDDVHGYDFVREMGDPSPPTGGSRWHGTHVAGIIGAAGNNGTGVTGVNWAVSLMALRALGPAGGRADDLARAIDYATDHGARIINASWGGGGASQAIARAVQRAGEHGVLFVAAAGNAGADTLDFPASLELPTVLSVGATTPLGTRAAFSNRGALVEAPGVGILSTTSPGNYERYDGTSMASPHVAGVAALLLAAHPNATLAQVRSAILSSTAGSGELNAGKALAALDREEPGDAPLIVSRPSLAFASIGGGPARSQVITIRRAGGGAVDWTASANASWVKLSKERGTTPARLAVSIDPSALGTNLPRTARLAISAEGATPTLVEITIRSTGALLPRARGVGCRDDGARIHVKAGTVCTLEAPGLETGALAAGLAWRLPGGDRIEGGRLVARFTRRGHWPLRVVADDGGNREVQVTVD